MLGMPPKSPFPSRFPGRSLERAIGRKQGAFRAILFVHCFNRVQMGAMIARKKIIRHRRSNDAE
jgi:hypothetical protein